MDVLLDTHVALWTVGKTSRVPKAIRDLLLHPRTRVHVSVVNVWEIAIKKALGKRSQPSLNAAQARSAFVAAGYLMLDVTAEHAIEVERLPLLHHDPFDRLLIAQAMVEPLRLITHDALVASYSPTFIQF